jgi:hypothetical protein
VDWVWRCERGVPSRMTSPGSAGVSAPAGKERRMLSVITDAQAQDELHVDLDAIVREGARRMLAAALEAEVDAYLAAHTAERDAHGRRLVVRNGHARQRQVMTAAGRSRSARRGSTIGAPTRPRASGSGSAHRSCRRGAARARRWPRCCRCCTCTGCPLATSCLPWRRSLAPQRGYRPRSSPAWSPPGRPSTRASAAVTCPTATMCTSGPMGCTSGCAWNRLACAVW